MKNQFNLGNMIALVGLLLTSRFFTWSGQHAGEIVTNITVNSPKFNRAVDSVATYKVDSLIRSGIMKEIRDSLISKFSNDDGEKIFEEIKVNNQFASDFINELDGMNAQDLESNHKKINEFFKKDKMAGQYCDRIFKKDGRPVMYEPCEGNKMLPISFGIPTRVDGKRYVYAVYYVKLNGTDYVLNRISNVLIE